MVLQWHKQLMTWHLQDLRTEHLYLLHGIWMTQKVHDTRLTWFKNMTLVWDFERKLARCWFVKLRWRLEFQRRHSRRKAWSNRNEIDEHTNKIVARALDGHRYLLPLCEWLWEWGGQRGSGPEGADDLCCFYLSLKAGIRAWRLELGPWGLDLNSRLGFELRSWDFSLEAKNWASRLGFEPRDWDLSLKT